MQLSDGRTVPDIGFGTYLTPPAETEQSVHEALNMGYRFVDTATVYRNEAESVAAISKYLSENKGVTREEIVYQSKLWQDDFGSKAAKGVAASVEKAKAIGKIDIYLLHTPGTSGKEERRQTWAALEAAVEAGQIVDIGVSNWSVKHLTELLEAPDLMIKPSVNQIEINPWLQRKEIVDFCTKNGISIQAYSPLMRGKRLDDPQLVKLTEKYNKTPAQILISWNIQRGFNPLPKSVNPKRIKENFEGGNFTMDKADVESLGDPNDNFVTVLEWDPSTWD